MIKLCGTVSRGYTEHTKRVATSNLEIEQGGVCFLVQSEWLCNDIALVMEDISVGSINSAWIACD